MKNLLINAELRRFTPKISGECGVMFNLPAIDKTDLETLFEIQGMTGWLLFSKAEVQPEDIPKFDPELDSKSKAKRLRNTLFILWKKKKEHGEVNTEFDTYYSQQMERIIDKVKSNIEKYE